MNYCIFWHGDVNDEDEYPVIRMKKPGESNETQTYVTRILVFLYGGELEMMKKIL